ncbi:MAG: PaaI family thioesterase [Micromonosporaceae bacterium]
MTAPSSVPDEPHAARPGAAHPGTVQADTAQPRRSGTGNRALAELFGYRIVSFGEGRCVVEWTPAPPFVNAAGGVWGGAVSAVVDNVCAMSVAAALDPPPRHLPTVSMHVDFLRPLAVGGTYLLNGHALRVGGRLAVADTHVMDADEQLLARATCTFSVRR